MTSTEETENRNLLFTDDLLQGTMLQALNMMRRNKHFCDVILHVDNHEIHAHRCVLASVSPYLLDLFTADQDNNQRKCENVITYKLNGGFDKLALQRLVDYAYTSILAVPESQVRAVYLAARQLKMDRVVKQCIQHLISNLNIENCIETRWLPGIAKNREFVAQVDSFISSNFDVLTKSKVLLSLNCVKAEILNQTKQEMSLGNPHTLCQLVLDWIKREIRDNNISLTSMFDKTHMLYLALDNSLQDCFDLPSEDVSNTEIVRDYKKLSLKNGINGQKIKRKCLGQPSKPRVLIYSRDINVEDVEQEFDKDWNLIASSIVGEHTFLALVTISGRLSILSVQLRLNPPVVTPGTRTPPEGVLASAVANINLSNIENAIGMSGTNGYHHNDMSSTSSNVSVDSEQHMIASMTSSMSGEEEPDLYANLSTMLSGKCALGCIGLDDSIIVCGGYDRVECLKTVEQYFPLTNTWIALPNMRENRGRFQTTLVNNVIYAIGGSNGHTELASVEKLDLEQTPLKWQKSVPMPLARSNAGVSYYNNQIYVIGGWNGQAGIKQCDVYDPKTDEWSSAPSLNIGRHQAGVAAFNNTLYVIGGTDNWNCLNTVEIYDPENQTAWSFSKPLNTTRRGCGVCVFQNKIYVVGGSDGTSSLKSTEIFDESSNTWTIGPNMTTARANVAVTVVGNRLYAIGGFSGKSFLNSIEYLDAHSNEWTTFIPKIKDVEQLNLSEIQHDEIQSTADELNGLTLSQN